MSAKIVNLTKLQTRQHVVNHVQRNSNHQINKYCMCPCTIDCNSSICTSLGEKKRTSFQLLVSKQLAAGLAFPMSPMLSMLLCNFMYCYKLHSHQLYADCKITWLSLIVQCTTPCLKKKGDKLNRFTHVHEYQNLSSRQQASSKQHLVTNYTNELSP